MEYSAWNEAVLTNRVFGVTISLSIHYVHMFYHRSCVSCSGDVFIASLIISAVVHQLFKQHTLVWCVNTRSSSRDGSTIRRSDTGPEMFVCLWNTANFPFSFLEYIVILSSKMIIVCTTRFNIDISVICIRRGFMCFKSVFLNRRAAAQYRALASIIPGRESFSWNLSFLVF